MRKPVRLSRPPPRRNAGGVSSYEDMESIADSLKCKLTPSLQFPHSPLQRHPHFATGSKTTLHRRSLWNRPIQMYPPPVLPLSFLIQPFGIPIRSRPCQPPSPVRHLNHDPGAWLRWTTLDQLRRPRPSASLLAIPGQPSSAQHQPFSYPQCSRHSHRLAQESGTGQQMGQQSVAPTLTHCFRRRFSFRPSEFEILGFPNRCFVEVLRRSVPAEHAIPC